MKKSEVEHIIRAARRICEEDEFIIVGSQSLHGKHPNLVDDILVSQEVDIFVKNRPERTERLSCIGAMSDFHETFGYYADPVDFNTSILPKNWKNRLVHLKIETDTEGAKAYCLEPHDLFIAKLSAGREKDFIFVRALVERGLVKEEILMQRFNETKYADPKLKDIVEKRIAGLFAKGPDGLGPK